METSEAEKRADAKRLKPLAAPKGGCLSAGLGERSGQGFSFVDGISVRAYAPGTRPTKEGWVPVQRADPEGGSTHTRTRTRHPACAPPASSGLSRPGRRERRVVTPASAERALRPLQLAPGGQQEPGRLHPRLRAQQKNESAPSPSAGLRRLGAARLGEDLPKGRGPEGSGRHPHLSP